MSKEGILIKENSKGILSKVDRNFFDSKLSKLGAGQSKAEDPNTPAMVAMHEDMRLASGRSPEVRDMSKAREVVKNAESQYLASQAIRQQGGMSK